MIQSTQKKAEKLLRITPLGGLGEVGKNMTVYETRNDIIVVDCGLKFPDSTMLGVDLVIPDITYLKNKKRNIRGIIITHGHEDHKGAISYMLTELGNPPIYATKLTQGLISVNLKEHGLLDTAILKIIKPRQEFALGDFHIEPVSVNHSIPDSVAFAIRTPVGTVFQTGDFKFDYTPPDKKLADIGRMAEIGDDGVIMMLSDSTNAEVPGYTVSESVVAETVDRIFSKTTGRMIVASFSTNLNRIQQMIDASARYGRKVCIIGRSMVNNVNIAMELGYLKVPQGILVPPTNLSGIPDHKLAIISTGSQGEAYSVLVRMANGTHKQIRIKKGDTVIISATAIPGNEESVYKTINDLLRLGAEVIHGSMMDVHVSGHACQEEHKLMLSLIRPRYFMPAHGERRHLVAHARMAQDMGIPTQNIFIMDNGHTLEITDRGVTVDTSKEASYILVDGSGVGDIGNVVLKDRQIMSESGIFLIMVNIKKGTAEVIGTPEIVSRGFVYVKESKELIKEAKQLVLDTIRKFERQMTIPDPMQIRAELRTKLHDFLYEKTERDPMILPVVIEI
ncbi:ribonuclease J [Candidatus Wirthbacteria bacterium CG2_30_54_11]|uniref:Ribonuclease J n=1 Tax=Candidatus Wirthbacteria bacterium CG2_30_54_11 TaxID=1817892 RepID=A0A1J5J1G5_9BACT|nr:MAG: ribonuclease J [Candidatus Wirthbacteria bacterium CG2_30_54_11]